MLRISEIVFSVPLISQIESIGGGRVGVGGGSGWGAKSEVKHPLRLKEHCCAFSKRYEVI